MTEPITLKVTLKDLKASERRIAKALARAVKAEAALQEANVALDMERVRHLALVDQYGQTPIAEAHATAFAGS